MASILRTLPITLVEDSGCAVRIRLNISTGTPTSAHLRCNPTYLPRSTGPLSLIPTEMRLESCERKSPGPRLAVRVWGLEVWGYRGSGYWGLGVWGLKGIGV